MSKSNSDLWKGLAIVVALISSPVALVLNTMHQNTHEFNNRIELLDNRQSHIFNSVADCTAKKYSKTDCKSSLKEALNVASSFGVNIKYNSASECVKIHRNCQGKKRSVSITGKNRRFTTDYSPQIIAWQAAQDNIQESVPLYQSVRSDIVLRADGAQLKIP